MNNIILFQKHDIMGNFPYKNYNCSIFKLNCEEVKKITNNKYNKNAILIIFFVSSSCDKRFGTMSWIGIICHNNLLKLLDNDKVFDDDLWIIKPHLIQNDKGPKYADLRIFKTKNNIAVIGYSRLAPKSNTNGISDYYVRVSLLDTKINNNLYVYNDKSYHFNEIDGGCFPSKIGNNYKKFTIKNDKCRINNLEFYIKNNNFSKKVTPHKSKNKLMPSKLMLNGIEVSFSKKSSNEDFKNHISTKNIIPLQHIDYLDDIGCFVDVSPPKLTNPILTIQNLNTGHVYYTDIINTCDNFVSKKYRGSTPFIEISNKIWITLLHKRLDNTNNIYNIIYEYFFVFYSSKNVNINNTNISIPNKCIYEIKFDDINFFGNEFLYITGLVVNNQIYDEHKLELELLISYGISDKNSGISKLKLKVPITLFTPLEI